MKLQKGILAFMSSFLPRVSSLAFHSAFTSRSMMSSSKRVVRHVGLPLSSSNLYSTADAKTEDTANSNNSSNTQSPPLPSTIFGGDYAGHSATFSSVDGTLIRVPDHYVPEAMVEWGQVPSCFECIVSEDIVDNEEKGEEGSESKSEKDSSSTKLLERNIVTVMPEVGCGLDNLDTMKSQDQIPLEDYQQFRFDGSVNVEVATAFVTGNKRRVEYIFVEHCNTEADDSGQKDGDDNDDVTTFIRTRISINLHENDQLKSPIEITKERKTSDQSTSGTIADGGGLDARTVSRLIGKKIFNKPFSDGSALDLASITTQTGDDNDDMTDFSLPGNVLVRYCRSSSSLETSLILSPKTDDDDDDGNAQPLRRIIVKRTISDGAQGTVKFCEEGKVSQ